MLTDAIAKMIEEMLNEGNGILELQRNEMALRLGCVPSQISYVISSRFTPERGYVIESRRGGGGQVSESLLPCTAFARNRAFCIKGCYGDRRSWSADS